MIDSFHNDEHILKYDNLQMSWLYNQSSDWGKVTVWEDFMNIASFVIGQLDHYQSPKGQGWSSASLYI